jgi:hypothetical protein
MSSTGENMRKPLRSRAALASIALISTGCWNAPAETGTGSGSSNNTAARHAQAGKFAACLRNNGVSAFPDPDASGAFTLEEIANGASLDPSTAAFQQATSACKDREPPGVHGPQEEPSGAGAGPQVRPVHPRPRRAGLPGPRRRYAHHRPS